MSYANPAILQPTGGQTLGESKLRKLEASFWVFFFLFLIAGYFGAGRSFAYLGIPPLKIFIGEIFLVMFVATWPSALLGTWFDSMVNPRPLTLFAWSHFLFLSYGIFEVFRGLNKGYPLMSGILNLVFNIYPVYVFVGFWFARRWPHLLVKLLYIVAFINAFYGLAFVGFLSNSTIEIPNSPKVLLFGQPGGAVFSLLGLIILGRKDAYSTMLILLNAIVILGTQVRGDWAAFATGLVLWGALTRNLGKVFQGVAAILLMLVIGLVTDLKLPAVAGRGGETSARAMIGRGLAGIDKDLAKEFHSDVEFYNGTLSWRKNWWIAIWAAVHQDFETTMLGLGYGYPLATLVNYIGTEIVATRTPHNIFYYALGYSGWIGVILFVWFQVTLGFAVLQTYLKTGFSFGIALYTGTLVNASWGNLLENPFGAIPFYVLMGMSIAQIMIQKDREKAEELEEPEAYAAEQPWIEAPQRPSWPPEQAWSPVSAYREQEPSPRMSTSMELAPSEPHLIWKRNRAIGGASHRDHDLKEETRPPSGQDQSEP